MPHPEPERRTKAPPGPERLLAGLTPEQAQAVTHGTDPLLLIAGPGAGKAPTLTHRIAYLLESEQARPNQIYTHYAPSEHEVEMVNRAFSPDGTGNKTGNKLSETQASSDAETPANPGSQA
jgi:hypothetical protein